MIGYVTVGTNDLPKAVAFYDALFSDIGAGRFMESETFVAWASSPDKSAFSVTKPFDGNAASVGNGVMVAFELDAPEKVDAMYAKAISLGAADEGKPGPRGDGFYAGYFRDLDGNKLNFFYMPQPV
ncbi:VOC family protein [Alteromonas sediminis]|uniref:VOC family protein n=1 Tax=Alteromonas sediminis TaxID=2259342 RepID=A0A3N5Y5L0_9ALTE|nr:VOC family protein [Alteromonas sediminis]RPJ68416.1 VOC family protein [Alteromonas sediminis]